ncbi:hypothetical protein [Achromobacter sp. AGC39]
MTHTPTLQEELERKAFELIEKLAFDRENGRITEAEYRGALDAAWHSWAGLVATETMEILSTMRSEFASQVVDQAVFFHVGSKVLFRVTNTMQGSLQVIQIAPGQSPAVNSIDCTAAPNMHAEALRKYRALGAQLIAKGFKRIV